MVSYRVGTLALACLVAVSVRRADAQEPALPSGISDWKLIDSGVRLTLDLDQLGDRLKQALPRAAPGGGLGSFDYLRWRFSALRVKVDSVVARAKSTSEMSIDVAGGVEATREKREVSLRRGLSWVPDGDKRIAQLFAAGRLLVAAAGGDLVLTLAGDTLRGVSALQPIHGAEVTLPLGGATLVAHRIKLDKLVFAGVRVTGVRISGVTAKTATLDLDLEVD